MMRRFLPLLVFALTFALGTAAPAVESKKKTTSKPVPTAPAKVRKVAPPEPTPAEPVEASTVFDANGPAPEVRASSVILLDASNGTVLLERNADQMRPVASTQKLLTGLLIAETGNMTQDVRVQTPDTWAEPSMLNIRPGEVYSRQKLLQILLIHSMNDVARCLARDNAGSIEAFATRMNAKAAVLGMTHSHFVNPNGLPVPGQYSTARDMARVAFAAYRSRTIRSIVCMKSMLWEYNDGRTKLFETTNSVLKSYPFCNGMKTGYTDAAGHCLISSASNGTRDIIAVVLGAKSRPAMFADSYKLLAWGLAGNKTAAVSTEPVGVSR